MNIWIGIPSGGRAEQCGRCCKAWQEVGVKVCLYRWDKATYNESCAYVDLSVMVDRQPFSVLQNRMMADIPEWDGYICGADDLWPDDVSKITQLISQYPDKLLWVADGFYNAQATHPVFGRKFYDTFHKGSVFDESFIHNYVDTDLFIRMARENRIVKCFDVKFDHRHHTKTGIPKDKIYELGDESMSKDQQYFHLKHQDHLDYLPIPEVHV